MKKIVAAIFLALASIPIFANPSLEDVAALLAKNKLVRGNFVLERKAASKDRGLKSSGEFVVAADYGMIWKTLKPIKSTQVMAKNFALTESGGGKRTKMQGSENPVYSQMAVLTSALWTNDLEAVYAAADVDFWSDQNSWSASLFPKDGAVRLALEKIVLSGTCSGGQAKVQKMTMILKGGNSAEYDLSGHSFGGGLSAAELSYFE